MSLTNYLKKRKFETTPEPTGGKKSSQPLRFVVQKHAATQLHYDFRLELDGVLLSWAVPKGPSMNPAIKRLAVRVEDHPFDYRNFEGNIPKGNYGGGAVMVWDEGTYQSTEVKGAKTTQEKNIRQLLAGGKLKFTLVGHKLKGTFALVKAQGRSEKEWLLMKLTDDYATQEDVTLQDKSVVSGKTIEGIANVSEEKKHSLARKNATKKTSKKTSAKRKKIPAFISPMLATLVDKPVDQEGWLYEIKWDGYRTLAFSDGEVVELKSRNNKSFNEKFYPVVDAVKALGVEVILDGEVVARQEDGKSNFGALQNWRSEADGDLVYYVFDILRLKGKDLTALPLVSRREILQTLIPQEKSIILLSDTFETSGTEFFHTAQQLGLEGIIAKKASGTYQPGERSANWLKIKVHKRQEVVIGGFTRNKDSSKLFSALLVGVYHDGKLVFTGKVGTGFTEKMQREMMKQFTSRIRKTSPFSVMPDVNKPSRFRSAQQTATATWLKPNLVCEVHFAEMTSDGVMRQASFAGMRSDKPALEVVQEQETPADTMLSKKDSTKKRRTKKSKPDSKKRSPLLNSIDKTQVKTIQGHELKFTNLNKVYWPKEKITKRDLLNYYDQMAPYILPYLKDRPQSLNRFPNGITGKSFYQKDVTGKVPDWITKYRYHSESETRDKHFMVATHKASLLYMVSLGCIELNPWSSTIHKPDHPDWCIIDLDPSSNSFNQVIETAQITHTLLEGIGVPSYCKTSGSTGLHIYIPLGANYTYEQSKEFARVIATLVHQQLPKFTSIERAVKDRKGKLYIDFLQNRSQATLACAYSVRPKPGATVSMPLHWDEVKKGLQMSDFTIKNALERVRSEGDLFKPVLGKGINLNKVVRLLG